MTENLLQVQNAVKIFSRGLISADQVTAVEHVSLSLSRGEPKIIVVAGESGSGKSTLGLMVLGFLEPTRGRILFKDLDIYHLEGNQYPEFRRQVQAVFQNPFEAFNPFYPIDHVFSLAINKFQLVSGRKEARKMMADALKVVQIDPDVILGRYPHQLSGGQLQRIMLARAFLLKPSLLVADEPVSMIDASLRAIILEILVSLKEDHQISQLYITHDLSTALQIGDEILIMYMGNIVEQGAVEKVINDPQHPYTQLLISSIPAPDPDEKWKKPLGLEISDDRESALSGGCKFYPRCPHRMDRCLEAFPDLYDVDEDHSAACYLYD